MGKGTAEWNMKREAWEGERLKKETDILFIWWDDSGSEMFIIPNLDSRHLAVYRPIPRFLTSQGFASLFFQLPQTKTTIRICISLAWRLSFQI